MTTYMRRRSPEDIWFIIFIIIVIAMGVWLSSCTSYKRCYDKYGQTVNDTITHTYIDTSHVSVLVPVSADEVVGTLNTARIIDSLVYVSDEGKARATFWKDRYDSIRFKAECLPDTIKVDTIIFKIKEVEIPVQITDWEQPVREKVKENSWIEKVAMRVGGVVLVIALLVVLFFVGRKVIETYFPALKILKWFK
jgi:hypothetical protein